MKRLIHKSLLLLVLGTMLGSSGSSSVGPTCPAGGARQNGVHNGSFNLTVVGMVKGTGVAEVDNTEVSIRAALIGPDGQEMLLDARDMSAIGPYFAGNGQLDSETIHISGKLDLVKASRLTATFISSSGKTGRIIGRLPNESSNPTWREKGDDDEDDDHGNDH